MNGDNLTNPDFSCNLCKTLHASDWELKEHYWSLLHHVKLEQKEKKNAVVHECSLCQTKCKNLVDYGRHLNEEEHKQALEKAKEKKKTKPKPLSSVPVSTSSRYVLQKYGKQKLRKKSLMPNPNWHLSRGQNKFFNDQFASWKPGKGRGKDDSQEAKFPHANPNPFFNSNPFWKDNIYNDDNYISFCRNPNLPRERWKKDPKVQPNSDVKMNDGIKKSDTLQSITASRKYIVPLNVRNSPKNPLNNTLSPPPPVSTRSKNSETVPDSNKHSVKQPLPLPPKARPSPKIVLQVSDPSKASTSNKTTNLPKVVQSKTISPTDPFFPKRKVDIPPRVGSKATADASKLKTKVSSDSVEKSKVPVSKSIGREKGPIAGNKKVTGGTAEQGLPRSFKKKPTCFLKDNKQTETQTICSAKDSKSLQKASLSEKTICTNIKKIVNPKNSGNDYLSKGCKPSSLPSSTAKRQHDETDPSDLSSSYSNPTKKQKVVPKPNSLKNKPKVNQTTSPLKGGEKNLGEKSNPSVSTDSLRWNNEILKDKAANMPDSSHEVKSLKTPVPSFDKKENCFKVNEELVSKLRKKLISQYPINRLSLKAGPKPNGISENGDADCNSRDEANSSSKLSVTNIRQEELVKMMKLPRLNRKEKMHLSSLLQSYTKSQNKKLAAPRLTMPLSGLYDGAGVQDGTEISELELPVGMEEQITYLVKRENLQEFTDEVQRDLEDLSQLGRVGLQATRLKDIPISGSRKNNLNKEKTDKRKNQVNQETSSVSCGINKATSSGQHSSTIFSADQTSPSESNIQGGDDLPANTIENTPNLEGGHSPSISSLSEPSFQGQADPDSLTGASQPLASANPDINTENIFNQVYRLTLREEQIRSSIVDMNEKMNYLRRLIEDSQMALQGCCVEHKRLLEEESEIRGERLKILQKAMDGKAEGSNPSPTSASVVSSSLLSNPSLPPIQALGPAVPNPQTQQTDRSRLPQQQPLQNQHGEITLQQNNNSMSEVTTNREVVPSTNSSVSPLHSCPLDRSSNTSTAQCQIQSPGVTTNSNPTPQTPNPILSPYPSLSNNHEKSINNGASETRNSCESGPQRQESNAGFESIVIKQERCTPPVSPEANIENSLLSFSKAYCDTHPTNPNSHNDRNPVLLTTGTNSERVHQHAPSSNNTTDPSSSGKDQVQARPLPRMEKETLDFERVQIKKEPVMNKDPSEGFLSQSPIDTLGGDQSASIAVAQSLSRETAKETLGSGSAAAPTDEAKEISSLGIEGQKESFMANPSENARLQPMTFDFSSVKIKEEPLTPPPTTERFFDSRLLPSNEESGPLVKCEADSGAKDYEIAENVDSFSMGRNVVLGTEQENGSLVKERGNMSLEAEPRNMSVEVESKSLSPQAEARNTSPEKSSSGVSMTYLGSMPNDFLQQLTLSWSKQKPSATVNNPVAPSDERSFSDGEFSSDQTGRRFLSRTPSSKLVIPNDMNPRVCLERLDMKTHRKKRTLSEPVSAGGLDRSSSKQRDGSEDGSEEDQDGSVRLKRSLPKKTAINSGKKTLDIEDVLRVGRKNSGSKLPPSPTNSPDVTVAALPSDPTIAFPKAELAVIDLCSPDKNIRKGSNCSATFPEDSSWNHDSGVDQNNCVVSSSSSSNEASRSPLKTLAGPLNPAQSEITFPLKSSSDPMNILNNLNLLQVVRTKKFSRPFPPQPPAPAVSEARLPMYKGANSPVNGLQIFDNHLYVSYQGNSPCKFSIKTGECLQVYNCKPYSVQCMLVCPIASSKAWLLSGGASELLLIFDEATGKLCCQIDTCKKIYSLHENWGHMFVGLADGGITKINQKSLRKSSELSYGNKPINCLASCTEGSQKLLFVGAYDASILIVDAVTGLLIKTLNCYHRLLYSIKVHQNLIFSCSSDKTLQVHDIRSGKLLHCLQDHSSTISCLHVEDNLLVTGSHDKSLNVYNSSDPRGAPLTYFSGSKEAVSCLAVHERIIYCGNFFGCIEAIPFDLRQKWVCQFGSCKSAFGRRSDLSYHLLNGHFKKQNPDITQCLWQYCRVDMAAIMDIAQHCEYHVSQITPPKEEEGEN